MKPNINSNDVMEPEYHFKNGTEIEINSNRREFLRDLRNSMLAILGIKLAGLAGCSKPGDEPDPNGGGGGGGGSGKTPKDNRSKEKIAQEGYDLIKKCCQDHGHNKKEALEHFTKNLDVLVKLDEKDFIGYNAEFRGNLGLTSKGVVDNVNTHTNKITGGDSLERKRTYGFDLHPSGEESNTFYYLVEAK